MRALSTWLPTLAWALVIFLFSSRPTGVASQVHWQDFIVKKTAHVVEYAIFATLVYRSLRLQGLTKSRARFYAFAVAVLYGITDEIHQSFTPGREPRARDVIFDTIGAFIATLSIWKLLPKMPTKLISLAKELGVN